LGLNPIYFDYKPSGLTIPQSICGWCQVIAIIFPVTGSTARSFMKSPRCYLPQSCRGIAWVVSCLTACGSGFVTVYFSQDFQQGRYVLWMQSVFVTFLFCNFIIQPLGILLKAIYTALLYRKDPTVCMRPSVSIISFSRVSQTRPFLI